MDSGQDAKNNAEALRNQVSKVRKVTQPKLRCKNVDGVVERRDGQLLLLDYTRHEALGLVWENPAVGERGDAGYRAPQWSPAVTRKRNECWRRHRALSAIPTADAKAPQEELDRIKAQKNATLETLMERQGPPIRTYRGSEAESARPWRAWLQS